MNAPDAAEVARTEPPLSSPASERAARQAQVVAALQPVLPAHALLTKADKLSRGAAGTTLLTVRKELASLYADSVTVQTFSAEAKTGVDEVRRVVAGWLGV